jgi:hypothetical protein
MMPSSEEEEKKEERQAQLAPLLPTTMSLEDLMITRLWPLLLLLLLVVRKEEEVMLDLVMEMVDLEEGMTLAVSSQRMPLLTMGCLMDRLYANLLRLFRSPFPLTFLLCSFLT